MILEALRQCGKEKLMKSAVLAKRWNKSAWTLTVYRDIIENFQVLRSCIVHDMIETEGENDILQDVVEEQNDTEIVGVLSETADENQIRNPVVIYLRPDIKTTIQGCIYHINESAIENFSFNFTELNSPEKRQKVIWILENYRKSSDISIDNVYNLLNLLKNVNN